VWSAEVDATDAFTPLTLAAAWVPSLRLGTAIVSPFTRGPAILAQSAASLADAASSGTAIGIGASSNIIVEGWNGTPFTSPYSRVRDTVRFLKAAFTGEKVVERYDTFSVDGFRLRLQPEQRPAILVAALRERMLKLAGAEADGAILTWLSAEDVAKVVPIVQNASEDGAPKEIVARIFVCPSTDADQVRAAGRSFVCSYLNVPVYAGYHEWLGHGDQLRPMWDAWKAGDRKAARAAVPDHVVDSLIMHGTAEECRAKVAAYVTNGVTTTAIMVVPVAGVDVDEAVEAMAPRQP
jgi:probable F420-dependent oxidoreductase